MNPEIKAALDALQAAFAEFKRLNDQRLATIEARGSAPAELETAVNRANSDITAIQTKIDGILAAQRESETLIARIEAFGRQTPSEAVQQERQQALQLMRMSARAHGRELPTEATDEHVQQYRAYRQGFFAYVRRGEPGIPSEVRAAMTIGTDPEGGYFVPPDTTGRIVQFVYETSPLRQFCTVSTTSRKEKKGRNDLDEAGGGWLAEGGPVTETTTPKIGEWKIVIHDQYAEPRATQDELDDADQDVESWLSRKIGLKLGRLEATAGISGNGVTRPRGLLTYPAGVPSAAAWAVIEQVITGVNGGFAAAPAGGDVFFDTIGKLKVPYRANARWFWNRVTEAATRKLKDSDGAYLWQPGLQAGTPATLAGFPSALFEDMPAIATGSLSIGFGDLREAYELVDRRGITVIRDNVTLKGWVKFYTTRRVGGDVVNFEALKLIKFAA